jgi:hypothetical protein
VAVIDKMENKPLLTLAASYVRLGQLEEARTTMAMFIKSNPDWTLRDEKASPFQSVDPLRQRYFDDVRAAGLPEG